MPTAILLPMQIFAIGFVISLTIALLIKVMLDIITFISKKKEAKK
ncbi:hypothetical protein RBG61_04650 [Paludicola sp. MB14-C6]|nr:hypothetical protein [Paludicola sp. MB14-C6]WMJ23963.1 hypothetical protein RBG61_04650 [Paludicola sp. MB14-C6]